MDSEWTNNETYRAIPQMEVENPKVSDEPDKKTTSSKGKKGANNMFTQSVFDLTLITINICQICYILKVGPSLGVLYYIMLGLLGVSLALLSMHGFMGLFGRLQCSTPLSDGCFNCLYNTSLFMVVLIYLVNLVFNVVSLKETEDKCRIIIDNLRNRTL